MRCTFGEFRLSCWLDHGIDHREVESWVEEKGRHVTGPRPKLRVPQVMEKQAKNAVNVRNSLGED